MKNVFRKGLSVLLAGLCLTLSMSTSVLAQTTGTPEQSTKSAATSSIKIPNATVVKLNINGKEVTALHAIAPSPTIAPNDVQPPWTLSYHSVTSSHFQSLLATAIATALAYKFGGTYDNYYAVAVALAGGTYTEFTGDDYEDVYYYYQTSYIDPQLPYYVKQYIVHYRDSSLTQYVGTSTRYYYSNMPY